MYNNVINSIKLSNKMHTILMNSKSNRTSDPHRLLLNLKDKIKLKKTRNLKYQPQNGMKSFNYLMNHNLYRIFKIILNIS